MLQGMKLAIPIMVGYIPTAIAYGVIARQADIPFTFIILMSLMVYAGASQFMAIQMISSGTAAIEIIIATFILNFRHLIMSLSLHNLLDKASLKWKSLISFGITDESYAMATMQEKTDQNNKIDPYTIFGLFLGAYLSWATGSAIGALLYQWIPESISDSMAIALYSMFIGLLIPAIKRSLSKATIAGISMVICSVLYYGLSVSMGWSIVVATIIASTAGIFTKEEKVHE